MIEFFRKRWFLMVAIVTLLSGCSDGSGKMSQAKATAKVLEEVVEGTTFDRGVVVLAHPEPVGVNDSLAPYLHFGPNEELPGIEDTTADPIEISGESWFFWIDMAPGARFAHPGKFAVVNRKSGEVVVSDQEYWPVLNGVGLWTDLGEYWSEEDWVYNDIDFEVTADDSRDASRLAALVPQSGTPPGTNKKMALVYNGWETGESGKGDFETDANNMNEFFDHAGFETTYLGPDEDESEAKDGEADSQGRTDFFDAAGELEAGDTLVVYMTGHGNVSSQSGMAFSDSIWENQLVDYLDDIDPGVNIIVVIDSCHSGGFHDSLSTVADLTITATSNLDSSYGDVDGEDDPNPNDKGGEFTSGLVMGLWELLTGGADVWNDICAESESGEESFWERFFAQSFVVAVEHDLAAKRGWSFPMTSHGLPEHVKPDPLPEQPECTNPGINDCYPLPDEDPFAQTARNLGALLDLSQDSEEVDIILEAGECHQQGNDSVLSNDESIVEAYGPCDTRYFGCKVEYLLDAELVDAYDNTDFPCGEGEFGMTLCPGDDSGRTEGEYAILYNLMDSPVPIENDDYYYTFAFVFDSDGDLGNNWVPAPAYPKDFFADTDRWYVANYGSNNGWSMKVQDYTTGSLQDVPSGARMTISQGAIMLVVPTSEFASSTPGYRVTSFRHTGDYGMSPPHDWTGDIVPPVDEGLATFVP